MHHRDTDPPTLDACPSRCVRAPMHPRPESRLRALPCPRASRRGGRDPLDRVHALDVSPATQTHRSPNLDVTPAPTISRFFARLGPFGIALTQSCGVAVIWDETQAHSSLCPTYAHLNPFRGI